MLEVVSTVLLAAHLMLIDVAMIGPLASAWFDWRSARNGDAQLGELARRLAVAAIVALLAGGVLGGLLLLLRYLTGERYFRALEAIPVDRLWFAGAEFLFGVVCLAVYAGLWRRWRRGRLWHRLLAVAGATNLMLHFPALFTVISLVSTRPGLAASDLNRAEFRRLLVDGEVISRVVHVWLAAIVVTGLVVVWLAVRGGASVRPVESSDTPSTDAQPAGARLVPTGARLALAGTLLQFPVGIWVALAIPETERDGLLGGDTAATLLFLASVLLAMWLMHELSALALAAPSIGQVWRASGVLVALVCLMVGTRVRLESLTPAARRAEAACSSPGSDAAQALASQKTSVSIGGLFTRRRVQPLRSLP